VLSHADPSLWSARYKTTLINFVSTGDVLCQACHSVSDLEVNVTHCLSTGLILYEAHSNGMLPYIDGVTAVLCTPRFGIWKDGIMRSKPCKRRRGAPRAHAPGFSGIWASTLNR
jgi:hypothetical protein